MATIINLHDVSRRKPGSAERMALGGTAQLFLFTGVRYERRDERTSEASLRRRDGRKSPERHAQQQD